MDDTASSLASVVGSVRTIQDEFTELKTQKEEFKAAIQAATPATATDNAPLKATAAASKAVSAIAPEITKTDREGGDNGST